MSGSGSRVVMRSSLHGGSNSQFNAEDKLWKLALVRTGSPWFRWSGRPFGVSFGRRYGVAFSMVAESHDIFLSSGLKTPSNRLGSCNMKFPYDHLNMCDAEHVDWV